MKFFHACAAGVIAASLSVGFLPCSAHAAGQARDGRSSEAQTGQAVDAPTTVSVRRASADSLRVSWSRVTGADGYVIYRASGSSFKQVETIRAASTRTWTDGDLGKRSSQVYKIRAFATIDGKRTLSEFSYAVSAKTYAKGDRLVNAGGVKAPKTLWIGVLGDERLKAKAIPATYGSRPKKVPYSKKLRYIVSDASVLKVSAGGIVRGRKIGTAKVRILTHNGLGTTVTVTVRSYANAATFDTSTVGQQDVKNFLATQKDDLVTIVAYFLEHRVTTSMLPDALPARLELDDGGKLVNESNLPLGAAEPVIVRVLRGYPKGIAIVIDPPRKYIGFEVKAGPPGYGRRYSTNLVFYSYSEEPKISAWDVLAPHWFVSDPHDGRDVMY